MNARKVISVALIAAMALGLFLPGLSFAEDAADTIYTNGNIYTVDDEFSKASAIAIKGTKIIAVGADEAVIEARRGPDTKVIDLGGRTVIPGLVESHMHYQALGTRLEQLDIFQKPKEEILALVEAEAERLEDGEWITASGWNHELWTPNTWPTKEDLDAVAPNNPVSLSRVDGHSTWFNSMAISIGGITKETPSPTGGTIMKTEGGELLGIFTDTAATLISSKIPSEVSNERKLDRYKKADQSVVSYGITTLVDAGISAADTNVLKSGYEAGTLKVRAYEMLSAGEDKVYIDAGNKPVRDLYDGKLSVNAVKLYADGSLGSRSAWLMRPYSDAPGITGDPRYARYEDYEAVVKQASDYGFQIGTHAIGDAAVDQVLDAYENVLGAALKDRRFRIEHFQIVAPEDIPRAVKAGVIASMQATHATSDMNMAEDRVGPERIKTSYAWRTIRNEGGIIANGSDAPVELVNPYHGLYAAVTRQGRDGEPAGGWYAGEALTREEALRSFTIWGAYGIFAENDRGSLEEGKYADFVVLDRDYMTCPASEIKDIAAVKTVIGGEEVYNATADTPGADAGTASGFADEASVAAWAKPFFERLIGSGIISGYADNTLKPKGEVTRAEFTKMAVAALDIKMGDAPKSFANDVREGQWYKEPVDIASSNGIIEGLSEGSFGPNERITRQDICVIMYRALNAGGVQLPASAGATFADQTAIADYAKDAVSMLRQLDIVGGRPDGAFDPRAFATREETAKIICGIIDYVGTAAAAE
ncbi:MAG: amidohydrolase family protein [Clostridiales Family XIII bacterium]|jgi:predicted amidohydrolase YtcJ|nr:amidohydrolase family protein [Clostridiales Family XIII bacterium]